MTTYKIYKVTDAGVEEVRQWLKSVSTREFSDRTIRGFLMQGAVSLTLGHPPELTVDPVVADKTGLNETYTPSMAAYEVGEELEWPEQLTPEAARS